MIMQWAQDKSLNLSPNCEGAFWIVLGGLFITLMGAMTKLLGDVNAFQITFFRALFGLLIILPLALGREGIAVLKTKCLSLHMGRGIVSALGMTAAFYAIMHMSLATATAITFTTPMFITILAFLVFRENISIHRWGGTALGFVGVLIIARPEDGTLGMPALVALFGAFSVGAAKLFVKQLAKNDGSSTILIYLGVTMTVFTAIPAFWFWQPLTLEQYAMLVLVGAVSMLAQSCVIRGYRAAEASAMAPMEYSRLIFASLFGIFLFAEMPEGNVLAGASIICASTLYVARQDALAKLGGAKLDASAIEARVRAARLFAALGLFPGLRHPVPAASDHRR